MRKEIVEDCLVLDMNAFNCNRRLSGGVDWTGHVQWGSGAGLTYAGTFDGDDDPCISLLYGCDGQKVAYYVETVSTQCHFGGRRFWFICPGRVPGGAPCRRRVGKLYQPPGSRYFLCRHCHDLSYRSRQRWQSRKIKVLSRIMQLQSQLTHTGIGAASQRKRKRLLEKTSHLAQAAHSRGLI